VNLYKQYINDVLETPDEVSKYVHQAVLRHVGDLEKQETEDFEYYFDEPTADWVINLVKSFKHTAGEFYGKPFGVQPFQAFILASVFGWLKKRDGKRRFDKLFISMARKNGKSELMAAIMVVMFLFDKEARANVYSAATDESQAKECFIPAEKMIEFIQEESPFFKKTVSIQKAGIWKPHDKSSMRALTRQKDGKFDGKNIHCSIVDEYHAHKTSDLLDVLESSTGSRSQPLTCIITTAGFDRSSPCYDLEKTYKKILNGTLVENETFCILFIPEEVENATAGDSTGAITAIDYSDPKIWKKGNPNLGVSLYLDKFKSAYIKAHNHGGAKWVEWLTKKCNVWTDSASTWLPHDIVVKCGEEFTLEDMRGRDCFLGLDLAAVYDLNSLNLFFPSRDGIEPHKHLSYHFVGKEGLRERARRDDVDYYRWVQNGHLILTEGTSTDYKMVKKKIFEIAEVVNVVELAYDRWNCYEIISDIIDEGITCQGFGQGYGSMSAPTKRIDQLYRNVLVDDGIEQIRHNNDPVLLWAFSNVVLRIDPAGNWKVDKDKSKMKVDPVVAHIMAYGQYLDYYQRDISMGVGAKVLG
jgi:phage terminase large subunit-like protein